MSQRKHRLRKFVEKWDMPWYVFTVVLYLAVLIFTWVDAPKVSNETLGFLILLSGFTAAMGTLIAAIKSQKPEEEK
jgi:hypothetical protein